MSDYLEDAFDKICTEAKETVGIYLSLVEDVPFYGGPEEGGWWGTDTHVMKYQHFTTMEAAEIAKAKVEELAASLEADAHRAYGEQCLREMEFLDARGLDADYLREPDGPSKFYVVLSDTVPENRRGCRHYE